MRRSEDDGEKNGGLHEKAETAEGDGDMSRKRKVREIGILVLVSCGLVMMMIGWAVMELIVAVWP